MDNWFKSPWFVRVISLAFAIVLYVFVQVETDQYQNDSRLLPNNNADVQTIENVPVNIRINEDRYVVSGVPEFSTVTLEGATGTLTAAARQQNFDIFVDLENLEEGTHTVDLKHTGVSEELAVYIEPKTIDVTIEERASEQFELAVDYINTDQLPDGYEIGEAETDPKSVTVTSSKEVIDQIAIVKVFVDVADLTEPIESREVPVNVYDARGNELNVRVEPQNVNVSVGIDDPSKSVPVNVETTGELPDGYSLSNVSANVSEVEVFATNDILDGIEEISTEEINLAEVTESGSINVELALPDGVSVAETETVDVLVELEQTKTLEEVPINVENTADGQDVTFMSPESADMDITVTGNQSDVSNLTAEDISVTVDTEGLETGEHDLAISLESPENIEASGEFEQVTVQVEET